MARKAATRSSSSSSKKRKATSSTTTTTTTTSTNRRRGSSSKNMFSKKKKGSGSDESPVEAMFHEIVEDPQDPSSMVNLEGIAQLGSHLGIDDVTEDMRILVLLWKMECCKEKNGFITLTEWKNGCESLQVDSWEALKEHLPGCELGFLENADFKDFYKFCFRFNLEGTYKTLDKELVVALLGLLFGDGEQRVPKDRVDSFCQFLEAKDHYAKITLDQWTSFLDFSWEVTDLDNYDESMWAWPVMLDEYVEYYKEQKRH